MMRMPSSFTQKNKSFIYCIHTPMHTERDGALPHIVDIPLIDGRDSSANVVKAKMYCCIIRKKNYGGKKKRDKRETRD